MTLILEDCGCRVETNGIPYRCDRHKRRSIGQETPYERHAALGHHTTQYSPNGVDKIEECTECPMRFLHNSAFGYPITLYPIA